MKPHMITLTTPHAEMWAEVCSALGLLFNVTDNGDTKVVRSYGVHEDLEIAWQLFTQWFNEVVS